MPKQKWTLAVLACTYKSQNAGEKKRAKREKSEKFLGFLVLILKGKKNWSENVCFLVIFLVFVATTKPKTTNRPTGKMIIFCCCHFSDRRGANGAGGCTGLDGGVFKWGSRRERGAGGPLRGGVRRECDYGKGPSIDPRFWDPWDK